MTTTEVLTENTLGGLKVQPVSERPQVVNMLVYGDPGVGKTVLAGSASEVEAMSPVLFIDVEGGTMSLRNKYPQVDVVRVASWSDMTNVYNDIASSADSYKTIVLDSLTEIQKFSMYNIMRDLVMGDPDRDPDVPGIREWGKNSEQIRRFVRAFRDLSVNTIFTALSATDKDQKTGITLSRPYLSGKLASEVAGFLDIVCYMYIRVVEGDVRRLMLTSGTDTCVAKDRSDSLPPVLEEPDMKTIHNIVTGA